MPPKLSRKIKTAVSVPIKKITPALKSEVKQDLTKIEVDRGDDIEAEDDDDDVPELSSVNYMQILKDRYEYIPIVNKTVIFLTPENRTTSEIMTKFEDCEVTGIRAKQIENDGICYTDVGDLDCPIAMAKKEILDKKCPLDIIRGITDTVFERWHVNEMIPYDSR